MTRTDIPKSAAEWSTFLLGKMLPTPFQVGKFALEILDTKAPSYATLAQQLSQDPVLSFKLMQAASKQGTSHTEFSKTLDHAMSMIGLDHVRTSIKAVPNEVDSDDDISALYYKKILARSLFSAHLARTIANKKGLFNGNELYWAGLFAYTPLWYLWRYATPEMRLLRFTEYTKHRASETAQQSIFNCTLVQIAAEMGKQLALPPLVKHCYLAENQLTPRQWCLLANTELSKGPLIEQIDERNLKMQVQHPAFIVLLTKLIADTTMHCWYSRASSRAIRILASYLHISTAEATKLCHEVAAEASRAHPMSGIFLPATRLFLEPVKFIVTNKAEPEAPLVNATEPLPEAEQEPTATSKQERSPTRTTAVDAELAETGILSQDMAASSGVEPNAFYHELTEKLYKHPEQFADVHELLNAATNALVYGLGMSRACITLVKRKDMRVKTHYSSGCQLYPELANFQMPLVKGTLFSRLSAKPAAIWVKASSEQHILDLVPSNFKQVSQCDDFFMMSLFVNDKPFAILYADMHPDISPDDEHYKYFKYLCKGLGMALARIANKAKSKAG